MPPKNRNRDATADSAAIASSGAKLINNPKSNSSGVKGKNNNKSAPVAAKARRQSEADDFERVLADLNRATAAVGKEREKQVKREKPRKERHEDVRALTQKPEGIDEEFSMMLRKKQQQKQFQQLIQQLLAARSPFLDAPEKEVRCEVATENPNFDVAVGEMQGWRVSMEDKHAIDVTFPSGAKDSKEGFFCVFDGHSGDGCAKKCSELIPKVSRAHMVEHTDGFMEIDFEAAYMEVDTLLEKELTDQSGCTAVTVHITPTRITCASVGDSRAVLCRNGIAVALSEDHKPDREAERARIEEAGGHVAENRVNGQLAMSRAMGDFTYKTQKERGPRQQLVIPVPDVVMVNREADDGFVVLACDGIFDVMSNDELIKAVLIRKAENKPNSVICEEICHECLAPPAEEGKYAPRPEGTDNMTIMIVDLK